MLARVSVHGEVTNVDTVTQWELLRAVRIAVDKANEEPNASVQTLEGAIAFC